MAPNVILLLLLWSWLHDCLMLPGSLYINLLCANVEFERSTRHNSSRTSNSQGGSLEQVAWVLATQKEKLSTIYNHLLENIGVKVICPIYL